MMGKKRLLIIDDDARVRDATRFAFKGDFEIFEASDPDGALRTYDQVNPHVVFLDLELKGLMAGWEILREIRKRGSHTLVLMVTSHGEEKNNPLASKADAFFEKPCGPKPIRKFLCDRGVLTDEREKRGGGIV